MSQYFKNRPVLKVFAALGACVAPLYLASLATGPSFGRLIDFKRKEEAEQLLKSGTYEASPWKTKLLEKFKHSGRSPIPFDAKIEDNFLKEISHAEGKTAQGFEVDFKPGAKEGQGKLENVTSSPEKQDQDKPQVDEKTSEPTSQQRLINTTQDDERQGRNPSAENVTDSVETPSKKKSSEDTSAHEEGEPITPTDKDKKD